MSQDINLQQPSPELFDTIAEYYARQLAEDTKVNKPTQLRRFYDELERWNTRVRADKGQFEAYLPLIRMLNAKVAYAKGRKLVDERYCNLMRVCLRQVETPETLNNMKLFLEAVMGFLKCYARD